MHKVIIDTGPLVAYLNKNDMHHQWAVEITKSITYPLLTCEAVLTESFFLLGKTNKGTNRLFNLLNRGIIKISFSFTEDAQEIERFMMKYSDIPMSFADACLVAMAEAYFDYKVLTIDNDLNIYRKKGKRVLPTIMPIS